MRVVYVNVPLKRKVAILHPDYDGAGVCLCVCCSKRKNDNKQIAKKQQHLAGLLAIMSHGQHPDFKRLVDAHTHTHQNKSTHTHTHTHTPPLPNEASV